MAYLVLAAWIVQGSVGIALLLGWLSHGRPRAAPLLTHVAISVVALGLWVGFVASGQLVWGWSAFVLVTIGNGFGDSLLVARSRRLSGRHGFAKDYKTAVATVFAGRLPRKVSFHALFSGVVYFGCLAACLVGTR